MSAREGRRDAAGELPPPRRLGRALIALGVGALVLSLFLPALSRSDALRQRIERAAAEATGFDVRIGALHFGYDLAVHLEGLSAAAAGQAPFFEADRAAVGVSLRGLFGGQPLVLRVAAPRVFVDRLPAASGGTGPVAIPFRTVQVEDGYLHVTQGGQEVALGPASVALDAVQAGQEMRLALALDPSLPSLDVVGTLDRAGGPLRMETLKLRWNGVPLAAVAERFAAVTPGTVEGTLDLSADVSGPLDGLQGSGSLRVQGLRYHTEAGEIRAALEAPFEVSPTRITFEKPGAHIADLTALIADLEAKAAEATLTGYIERDGPGLRAQVTIALAKVQGHDATLARAIEDLTLRATLKGHWAPSIPPTLGFDIAAPNGNVLWDRFYIELSQHPATLRGEIQLAGASVDVAKLEARAKGIGSMTGHARISLSKGVERLDGSAEVPQLGALYALAVRDPYKEIYPFLAQTAAQGQLSVRADWRRNAAGMSLTGRLRGANTTLSSSRPAAELSGLDLDLPIQLGTTLSDRPVETGRLYFDGLRIGTVEVAATSAPLTVGHNTIALAESLTVPVLGGTLVFSQVAGSDLASDQPRASLGMALQGLDLAALSQAMDWPPFTGTVSGAIPKVTFENEQISSEGEIRAQLFGGEVTVRGLRVEEVFSSVPTLGLDLDFDNLLLARLTETLEVGRISGVIRGAVHNLAIVSGQPSRFDAWVETVPMPHVTQKVSVTAIRQLSVLGGSGGDPLSQGVLSFFDEYGYAKMGFRCRLENDTFLLHGIETVDGKEFLVVGSFLPPRVNVVSHNQTIAFSEMVRRLSRVKVESAPAQPEGDQP